MRPILLFRSIELNVISSAAGGNRDSKKIHREIKDGRCDIRVPLIGQIFRQELVSPHWTKLLMLTPKIGRARREDATSNHNSSSIPRPPFPSNTSSLVSPTLLASISSLACRRVAHFPTRATSIGSDGDRAVSNWLVMVLNGAEWRSSPRHASGCQASRHLPIKSAVLPVASICDTGYCSCD
jgi:hypothetical protein